MKKKCSKLYFPFISSWKTVNSRQDPVPQLKMLKYVLFHDSLINNNKILIFRMVALHAKVTLVKNSVCNPLVYQEEEFLVLKQRRDNKDTSANPQSNKNKR